MKAICIEKDFCNSVIKDVIEPIKLPHQDILNVKAVGICQSDISRVFNQSAYYYPIILGHEFSGYVENSKKTKATVYPIIPCGVCDECKKENYAQCKNYSYYGSRQSGGMQERLAVNTWNLIPNERLDYEELALIEPSAVAMNAFNKVPNNAGSILINGCGFIALVVAQILLANGRTVYIRNRNQEKLKFALDNFDLNVYTNQSVDCVIDFVSNSASMNFITENINPHGTIIAVGNPSNEVTIDKNNYSKILRKELNINGIWNSKRSDWYDVIDLISSGKVDVKRLITHRYDYTEFKKAFEKIMNNQMNYNELIIKSMILF
jgi:L-iditol 2-dehydrogenase